MEDLATRVAQVIRTAKENLCKGIIVEPRFFFDEIQLDSSAAGSSAVNYSTDGVFKNGEDFPIHITKMLAGIRYKDAVGGSVTDERLIQRIGARLSFHGHDYQTRDFVSLPLWHNKVCQASYSVGFGLSSHKFDQPWLLSARDTIKVDAKLDVSPSKGKTREVTVSFSGYGLETQRPYFRAASASFDDSNYSKQQTLAPDRYRNDGDEPICVTDMTVHCSAQNDANNPQGDVRMCRVQVAQIGNGTQAEWCSGPIGGQTLMPGVLWGTWAGRAVIHEFPSPLIWEPGEGLQAELQAKINSLNTNGDLVVQLGFAGTLVVT